MVAQMPRYAPAEPGIRSRPRDTPTAQSDRSRHGSASGNISLERRIELRSGLLNGTSLLLLMAKSRHKKTDNVRRYFHPSPEAIADVTSQLGPG
jgi:hypothetical protein